MHGYTLLLLGLHPFCRMATPKRVFFTAENTVTLCYETVQGVHYRTPCFSSSCWNTVLSFFGI